MTATPPQTAHRISAALPPSVFDARDLLRTFCPEIFPETGTLLVTWTPHLDPLTGAGVRIALLDGGADLAAPDLAGASIETADFAGDPPDSPDDQQHATRDLTLLVGQGTSHVRGLTPKAHLLHARVLTPDGGDPESLTAALDWACARNPHLVVLPLGMDTPHPGVAAALDRALHAGVPVFAAAGNGFPRSLDFPARHPGVLAVGAADARGALLPSCARTPRLDLLAPGCGAPSRGLPGDGTSLACVLAAGVFALRHTLL